MTDTLNTTDDTEVITVDTDDYTPPPSRRPAHRVTPTCRVCGVELDDGRKKYCEEHRPSSVVERVKAPVRKSTKNRATQVVENGMSETIGKILLLLTLGYAYSALKRAGVPDMNGDIADQMALTDDESVAIARPLSRLFLSTEQGRKIAPTIVDNRDLIDAAFAAWDWYKRTNDVLSQYQATQSVQTPIVREGSSNGYAAPNEADRTGNANGYVPPAQQDLISAAYG